MLDDAHESLAVFSTAPVQVRSKSGQMPKHNRHSSLRKFENTPIHGLCTNVQLYLPENSSSGISRKGIEAILLAFKYITSQNLSRKSKPIFLQSQYLRLRNQKGKNSPPDIGRLRNQHHLVYFIGGMGGSNSRTSSFSVVSGSDLITVPCPTTLEPLHPWN